jgi:hypothetical protein
VKRAKKRVSAKVTNISINSTRDAKVEVHFKSVKHNRLFSYSQQKIRETNFETNVRKFNYLRTKMRINAPLLNVRKLIPCAEHPLYSSNAQSATNRPTNVLSNLARLYF